MLSTNSQGIFLYPRPITTKNVYTTYIIQTGATAAENYIVKTYSGTQAVDEYPPNVYWRFMCSINKSFDFTHSANISNPNIVLDRDEVCYVRAFAVCDD